MAARLLLPLAHVGIPQVATIIIHAHQPMPEGVLLVKPELRPACCRHPGGVSLWVLAGLLPFVSVGGWLLRRWGYLPTPG